jgi:DNA-binding LytR/AlgR family response regulator
MLVSKGADRCLIRIDDIQFLSAADNYVEIHARGQQFLMRSTMAEIEIALPAGRYVRIHRSHIVRIDLIEKIRTERSSTGFVQLRGGRVLPISKTYRRRLQQQKELRMH